MKFRKDENILVIPTAAFHQAGLFQGFCPEVDRYLPNLLDPGLLQFLPRSRAEGDPSFKQIIPYVVFKHGDQVFHYQRGKKGTEVRLRSLRSIGVGGHISADDVQEGGDLYRTGMLREVTEELFIDSKYSERCIGLINDDRTPVGEVHLGVVHIFDLEQPALRPREDGLIRTGFAPLHELREGKEEFETWSQFLLEQPASIFD